MAATESGRPGAGRRDGCGVGCAAATAVSVNAASAATRPAILDTRVFFAMRLLRVLRELRAFAGSEGIQGHTGAPLTEHDPPLIGVGRRTLTLRCIAASAVAIARSDMAEPLAVTQFVRPAG